MQKLFALGTAMVVSTAASAQAPAKPGLAFHGYLRSGIGASRGGSDQQCFLAPGASAKFRLGNECETYFEATFLNTHGPELEKSAGPSFDTVLTFAGITAGRHDFLSTAPQPYTSPSQPNGAVGSDFSWVLREAYVSARGLLGTSKPWIGMRMYRRQDIAIIDYQLLNHTGFGAGVEDIDAGLGKLQLAATRATTGDHDDTPAQVNMDARLTDIPLRGVGTLDLILIHGATGKSGHTSGKRGWEPDSGQIVGAVARSDFAGGHQNRVTLQFGRGLFGGDGKTRVTLIDQFGAVAGYRIAAGDFAAREARKKSTTTRIADELFLVANGQLSASIIGLYQTTDFGGYLASDGSKAPRKDETQLGLRPLWKVTKTAALALEYGYSGVNHGFVADGQFKTSALHKVTIAPQLTPGDYAFRPQLRLFATYATWNRAARNHVSPVYDGDTKGFSTGAQVESTW